VREVRALVEGWLDALVARRFDEVEALFAPGAVVAMDLAGSSLRSVLGAREYVAHARGAASESPRVHSHAEPEVRLDGALATVRLRYRYETEAGSASGVDVLQFVRLEEGWRIVSLSFSNRPG
jgi:hypothetical protein